MSGKQDVLRRKINWTGRISAGLTWALLMVIIISIFVTYNRIRQLAEHGDQNIRCAVQIFTTGNQDVTVKDYDKCVLDSRQPKPVSVPLAPPATSSQTDASGAKANTFTVGALAPIEPITVPPQPQPQTEKPKEVVVEEPKPPVVASVVVDTPVLDIETRINPVTGLPEFRVKGDRFWQVQ